VVAEHRSTRILTAAACAAIVGLAPVAIHAQKEPPSSPYEGRLAKAVYLSADVAQALEALVASAPAADKPVLTAAAERAKQPFAAEGKDDAPSAKGSLENRAALIRGMVAVVATPEARAESAAASQALLASSGPPVEDIQGIAAALGRAEAAEAYLKANRESALTPYLYGYLMVQYRIAFERQASAKALEGQKATAKKYRAFLLRGRASQDPLVKALVTDIDAPYFLERPTAEHPRDFDPDACCRNR
jgi:hypothetical protein